MIMKLLSRRAIGLLICGILLAVATFLASQRINLASAEASASREALSRAQTAAGLISSELQKYRTLPLVLSDYPDVQVALLDPSLANTSRLNARLELIADRTDASAIYLVDKDGRTIAASNWREPTSFVGQNYGFRPYFQRALNDGAAEQFALGTVSRHPGFFLAQRTASGTGVIVVKVEFDRIERIWAVQSGPTLVRDANGVIIISSKPEWSLRSTRDLPSSVLEHIRTAKLYGESGPQALAPDLTLPARASGIATDRKRLRYMVATVPTPVAGWKLSTLEPLEPAIAAAMARTWIIALSTALVAVLILGFLLRSREAVAMRLRAQQELELQVEARTAELKEANRRLVLESRERERNESRLRVAREELSQSNRLATLGQITAGVAHEINQPLSAMRTFAENAAILIEQGRAGEAAPNLGQIVSLTQRIGDITGELRTFARREAGVGPVILEEAIDGALLLVGDRLRQLGVSVRRNGAEQEVSIAADRVRVEQILVNLLQNALDAVAGIPGPSILISTRVHGTAFEIEISDNGPGITAACRKDLFKSFVTQKAEGLGLGLVISRNLAREVGGELIHVPSRNAAGATFLLTLPLA